MSGSKQGDLFGAPAPPAVAKPAAAAMPPTPEPIAKQTTPPPPPAAAPVPAWRRMTPAAPPRTEPEVWTVSQLTRSVKDALEPRFTRVLVRGEISNFRGMNARGHFYFALKDDRSTVDVKLWATTAQRLKFKLREGLAVIIEGSLDVYEPQGRYSLIVNRLEPEGVGAQALALEQLKQKLTAEGLIGEQRKRPKRPLPFLPRRVGVVTSVSGAALRDFLQVLHRRHPRLSVLVADARVQGDEAVFELRRALRWLSRSNVDVIVVTRGGGSADDLWTFNEEPVVRALWDCPVPVVSAVGHEIDTTLCDLVADVRAPTPSAAAELIAPSLLELETQLSTLRARVLRATEQRLGRERAELRGMRGALGDPRRELSRQRLTLNHLADRATSTLRRSLKRDRDAIRALATRLQAARPQAQLRARQQQLSTLQRALAAQLRARLRSERERWAKTTRAFSAQVPTPRVREARQMLANLRRRLEVAMRGQLVRQRGEFGGLVGKLDAYSPLHVLTRGYAVAKRADGTVLRSVQGVKVGDSLQLLLDGDDSLFAQVTEVRPSKKPR